MGVPTPQFSAAITGRFMMYQGNETVSVNAGIGTSGANVPLLNGANTWSGRQVFSANAAGNSGMATATDRISEIEVTGNGTGAAMMAFHRPGVFASYLGIDTDNQWKVGGWSVGANAYKIWHDGIAPLSQVTPGYHKLPSGLIIQWGTHTLTTDAFSQAIITLPVSFASSFLFASATDGADSLGGGTVGYHFVSASLSQLTFVCRATTTGGGYASSFVGISWLAIGV